MNKNFFENNDEFPNSDAGSIIYNNSSDRFSYKITEPIIIDSNEDELKKYFPNLNSIKRNYLLIIAAFRLNLDENLFKKNGRDYLAGNILKHIKERFYVCSSAIIRDLDQLMQYQKIDDLDLKNVTDEKFIGAIVDNYINEFYERITFEERNIHEILLRESSPMVVNPFFGYHFSPDEKIKVFFDAANCDLDLKKYFLRNLNYKLINTKNSYKKLEWFNDEEGKLEAAFDYFRKKNKIINCNFSNSDEVKKYFYMNFYNNQDSIDLAFNKICALYANRKSRSNKLTKQANFSLSDKSIKNIKKLSLEHGVTKSKIIDIVFGNESIFNDVKTKMKRFN